MIRFEDYEVEELRQLGHCATCLPRLGLIKQTSASCERLLDVCNTHAKICQYIDSLDPGTAKIYGSSARQLWRVWKIWERDGNNVVVNMWGTERQSRK